MNKVLADAPIFDRLSVLGDTTRSRILLLLERHELTVSELTAILQLPQSTVSRHLKVLAEDGWVTYRSEGTSRHYRIGAPLEEPARSLWRIVREEVAERGPAEEDAERARSVVAERLQRSREFFASSAGRWDELRRELFGGRSDVLPLYGLLDPSWTVGDLGCGTGELAAGLAPYVLRVVGVDHSEEMLEAARNRLVGADNVELRRGELERLPVEGGELDLAVLLLVLHYVADPPGVLAEARRGLRPGGRLVLVDMRSHDRSEYREEMGHLWQGFARDQLGAWLEEAGLAGYRRRPIPPDPGAQGPPLFVATAARAES
ncbi:MAG: metalloregulator ArsR/SmtB family transcription factor [Gemmatimonadetes bacterium]|nr:metalloregulator ArsR/SmtB family transcription factor [Gemmatimonadota bacterium]NIR77175.1 metalloregulator ArsR/SmtB family transcription factor [Gemmatimonadota bacterium]NIT85692.1 metalloregulator ArsR/SmtB family transcription factor [Gemmatimonadota bacterium]NIU29521.1 metalloregulator ArsR/SmtB family transcription factor [Gemmatimonadota bacterium]NIU34568.1 metalloregulator ArsR/SmtB family transcription factor [Gemmatimonadota bacterium]